MLFGLTKNTIKRSLILCTIAATTIVACNNEPANKYSSFVSPEQGMRVTAGSEFTAKLQFETSKIDSVVYTLDSVRIASKKDTSGVTIPSARLKMGNHILVAKIYTAGTAEEVNTNVIVLPSKAPEQYSFKIINTFPHDTSSYVEGLEYHDGSLYESAGDYGKSSLRRVDLRTGKVLQKAPLDAKYFGEGITIVGNKIVQLTYKTNIGFVYDKTSFKKLAEFPYPGREGWGLYFDGTKILNTDGSSNIYFLDKNTYKTIGSMEVYDNNGPVNSLNELEIIDGKIYANVYETTGNYADKILIINPETGAVEGTINLIGLNPEKDKAGNADYILNGIAWDNAGKRLFVTGKKWSKLFEIQKIKN